ncbi:hypothetical protein EV193_104384 [Herbihabitans rhizosphaerae]|uniref:Uncharacterized protein n=1 Tax=Herbihabitans rhizosphaerae TaxID=1872711 RepID=A0A4Q7KQP7_9PSEU|nr:hypothetical protein [Herbihabitans rhizosphaerae]RZS39168.1 hypothetical protein EV193_104384 [Herbihabitans rhizosphaerae]
MTTTSKLIVIDVPEAVALVRDAVKARGAGYVYSPVPLPGYKDIPGWTPCTYANGDEPGCIVGTGLYERYGVGVEELQELDQDLDDTEVISLEFPARFDVSDEAREVLAVAQGHQDNGKPWGYALTEAEQAATQYDV